MSDHQEEVNPEAEIDIQFQPVIKLPPVEVKTLEDDEDEIYRQRAKLFRYHATGDDGPEWKERGIGDMRILKHRETEQFRLVMRRDQTFKVCCNHFITGEMKLSPFGVNNREFVWSTLADFADEEKKEEIMAIRFRDSEIAEKFKKIFEDCLKTVNSLRKGKDENSTKTVTKKSSGVAAVPNGTSPSKDSDSGDTTPNKKLEIKNEERAANEVDTVVGDMKGLSVKTDDKKETEKSAEN